MKSIIQYVLLAILSIIAPVVGLLLAVAFAIFLDTLLGVFKAIKLKQKITSRKMSQVISKLVLYQVSLLTIYGMDHFLLSEFLRLKFEIPYVATKIVALVLIFVEATSIKENFESAFGINIFQKLKTTLRRSKEIKDDVQEIIE